MRRRPAFIDLGHPVTGLRQRMVRVAAARPVAQRHGGGHATFAGMNVQVVARRQQAQVQHIGLEFRLLQHFLRPLQHAKGLGDFARAAAIIARRAANQQHARGGAGVLPQRCGLFNPLLGFQPFNRQVVVRVSVAGACLTRQRRLAALLVGLPGDRFDARNRFVFEPVGGVEKGFHEAFMKQLAR